MDDWSDEVKAVIRMCDAIIDSQPQPVRETFEYCSAMMLVDVGRMQLVEKFPGDDGTICVFEKLAGDKIAVKRPIMSEEKEAEILEAMEKIFRDAGL